MTHKIERLNKYDDTRFYREVLLEKGRYIVKKGDIK